MGQIYRWIEYVCLYEGSFMSLLERICFMLTSKGMNLLVGMQNLKILLLSEKNFHAVFTSESDRKQEL